MSRFLCIVGLLIVSSSAPAQWIGGVSLFSFSDSDDGVDIQLTGVLVAAGYVFEVENGFYVIPEVRLGSGVTGDTVFGVDVDLDSFFSLGVRGQLDIGEAFYVFGTPSYARAEATASSGTQSESDDGWETGFGAGAGYKVSETFWTELSYETYDGTDFISLGIRSRF
ncbi:MAG: outer membrane beta-barrel protein [Pseudomonadota bacterium]